MFARVGPNETRKLATGDEPRDDPGARRRCPARPFEIVQFTEEGEPDPLAAASARRMADVTVKRIEDFEAIFGGGFRRVRAGLGVSSFGLAVMDLPPNFTDYPDHDQTHDHQEEVYTLLSGRATLRVGGEGGEEHELEPGVWIRVGPAEKRKIITGDEPARVLAVGGSPGQAYVPPEFTERAASHPPMDKHEHAASQLARRRLAEQVVGGRALQRRRGARAVLGGPEALGAADQRPPGARSPSRAPGRRPPASWSATAIAVAASSRPWASGRPRQSSTATTPGAADRDLGLARGATGARSCRRSRPRAAPPPPPSISARIRRAEASASSGSRATGLVAGDVGGVDAGVRADPAAVRLDDQRRPASRGRPAATRRAPARPAAGRGRSRAASSSASRARLDRRQVADAPLGLRDHLLRDDDDRRRRRARARRAAPRRRSARRARRPRRPPGAPASATISSRPLTPAPAIGPSRASAAAVAGARSGRSRERRGERRQVVGRVEVERQRLERLGRDLVARRARRGRGGARRCPRRTPGRSRRRARAAGRWCRCRGGRGSPRPRPARHPAERARRARPGRAAGSRRAAARCTRRRAPAPG